MRQLAVVLVGCLAATGCGWMFPDTRDVPQRVLDALDGMRGACDVDPGAARLAAAVAVPGDRVDWQLWVAEGEPLGAWVIAPVQDRRAIAGAGCLAPREAADELSAIGGLGGEGIAIYAGRLPANAAAVQVGGDPPIAVDDDGFFLVASEGGYESGLAIDALDADGDVVGSTETM